MGRIGITFDQVATAANALEAERPGSATLKAVRDYLGTGSQTTIHQHLKTWRENRPKAVLPTVEIPDEVRRTLTVWLTHASTLARAEAEERVTNAEVTADELARAGELVERERDDLLAELSDVTTQRDQEKATASTRAEEIARLQSEVERERDLAGKAQVDAAAAKLRADSQVEHLVELRARVESLSGAIEKERDARTAAEREAAVLKSQLEAVREQLVANQQELANAHERSEQERAAAEARAVQDQERIEKVRAAFDTRIQQDQDRLDQVRHEYEGKLDEQRRALDLARNQLATAAIEKAQLQERLSAVTGPEKE